MGFFWDIEKIVNEQKKYIFLLKHREALFCLRSKAETLHKSYNNKKVNYLPKCTSVSTQFNELLYIIYRPMQTAEFN